MGVSRRSLVLVVVLLGLSGCWLQPGFGPERRNFNPFESSLTPGNAATLQQVWSTPSTSRDVSGQPLVTPGAVITGFPRSPGVFTVRAVSRESGAPLWQRDLRAVVPLTGIGAFGEVLSVAGGEVLTARVDSTSEGFSAFEVLDPATGATARTVVVQEMVFPTGVGVDGSVIAYRALDWPRAQHLLMVRSRDSLDLLWTAPIAPSTAPEGQPVLIAGDRIILLNEQDTARTIDTYAAAGCGAPTCSPTSTVAVPPPPPDMSIRHLRLLTVTDEGNVLVHRAWDDSQRLNPGADVVSITPEGAVDWALRLDPGASGFAGAAATPATVFAVGADSATPAGGATLFAVSTTSGEVAWRADGVPYDAPIAAGDLVYVAGEVFAANGCGTANCTPLATVTLPGSGRVNGKSVAAGTLFVNQTGRLTAFAPNS